MSDLLKSKDIMELFGISAPSLFSYREIFNIEVIEKFEGKKKVYYYSSESVELIKQIMELKKTENSNDIIKKLLGISDKQTLINNSSNDSMNDLVMINESKIDNLSDGLQSTIEMFYKQFADTKNLQESLVNQSENIGRFQAESIEKDKMINQLKSSFESEINQLKTIYKLEMESLVNQNSSLKSELENKNNEIERLKSLKFWQKK